MALHLNTNKRLRRIFFPFIVFAKWFGRHFPEAMVRIRYFMRFHKRLNLKHPKTLNEKILWLSLRGDTTLWTQLADKHAVREYIKGKGLAEILVPQYAHFSRAEEIDFIPLPDKFVVKSTHGCGDALLVDDKSKLDISATIKRCEDLLKTPYGELEGGLHYMRMQPGITVEALLENDAASAKYSASLIDYKFYCFDGKPRYCMCFLNRRVKVPHDKMFYDTQWNPQTECLIQTGDYQLAPSIPQPKNLERMLEICEILAVGFPFVRIDLYNLNGKIYFGEYTFTPRGGMINWLTDEALESMGNLITLPK